MSAARILGVVVLSVFALAGCSTASAPPEPPAPVVVPSPPALLPAPQRVVFGERFDIADEFGTVVAKAAFTSLELDPDCTPDYGGQPPASGHYMFIGMNIQTTAAFIPGGGYGYPHFGEFSVRPADGPVEGYVAPEQGSDLCLPNEDNLALNTFAPTSEYQGSLVIETDHAAGELVYLPQSLTHTAGWKITYPAGAATTPEAIEPTVSDDPADHCDDPDWWNARQAGDPGDYVAACGQYPYWLEEPVPYDETDAGLVMPENDPNFVPPICSDTITESCTPAEDTGYVDENGNGLDDYYESDEYRAADPHWAGCLDATIPPEQC